MSQRRIYLVQKEMQGKFTLTLLMLIFLVAVISFCNLYVIGQYALDHVSTMGETTVMMVMGEALRVLWPRLLLIIIVNVIIVIIIGVFYSHQFAGPSYKLEKSIKEIAQGDLSFRIQLRKGDSMHNVADSLNQMVENFRSVIRKANELTCQMKETADKLTAEDEGHSTKTIANLKGIAGELEDLLAGFKTGESAASASTRIEQSIDEIRHGDSAKVED
ncbi:MAG: methyl-accepting chemotaxis protein [Candidatus Riflebacteria bacterium]|nr:methyl-accepting chemotaxis protein [Candidatus Riflebacteria bacterium]